MDVYLILHKCERYDDQTGEHHERQHHLQGLYDQLNQVAEGSEDLQGLDALREDQKDHDDLDVLITFDHTLQ